VYRSTGFNIPNLIDYKQAGGKLKEARDKCSVCDFQDADRITNAELLESDIDILIPAAMENQITAENASRIKAHVIVEAANGPISSDADEFLSRNGMLIIPDILANAGGVTVSYFEWVQNRTEFYWTEDEVHKRLQAIMAHEFETIYEFMEEHRIDMRSAAYAHALQRLGEAIEAKGTRTYFKG
jgi:glutamate dehydrogenase (NADP+)